MGCIVGKWIFVTFFCLISVRGVFCQEYNFVTLSTVKARSLAMGGAFVSIEDDLPSLDFNPATFSLNPLPGKTQFSLFFNPLGPLVIAKNRKNVPSWDVPLGWLIRGFTLSVGRAEFGVLLGEESLADEKRLKRDDIFDGTGYQRERNTSFGFALVLAPRVSLGIAGELFIRGKNEVSTGGENTKKELGIGYRYGLMIKTRNNLHVGLCFFDFPDAYSKDRMVLERLADETLNIGVSYSLWKSLILALDVRNVSDEGKGAVREPHAGVELSLFRHLKLRGGYYREKEGKETISLGLGVLDWNALLPESRRFLHPTLAVNTAMLLRRDKGEESRWFILSCILRF